MTVKVPLAPTLAGCILLGAAGACGVDLAGPAATAVFCAALLLFGLPHGTLDIERMRGAARQRHGVATLVALYLALALAMLLVWQTAPVIALALFLVIATVHFSEDWRTMGEPLIGGGMALSVLAAPAVLHADALRTIFGVVSGASAGGLLADGLILLAPVALSIAGVGIFVLLRRGRWRLAAVAVALLTAMVVAPPVAGFALFFCLFHSPMHLAEAIAEVRLSRARLLAIIGALTLAAFGIAALVLRLEWRGALSPAWTAATFMTLSILTVPHMLAPPIADRLGRQRASKAAALGQALPA